MSVKHERKRTPLHSWLLTGWVQGHKTQWLKLIQSCHVLRDYWVFHTTQYKSYRFLQGLIRIMESLTDNSFLFSLRFTNPLLFLLICLHLSLCQGNTCASVLRVTPAAPVKWRTTWQQRAARRWKHFLKTPGGPCRPHLLDSTRTLMVSFSEIKAVHKGTFGLYLSRAEHWHIVFVIM